MQLSLLVLAVAAGLAAAVEQHGSVAATLRGGMAAAATYGYCGSGVTCPEGCGGGVCYNCEYGGTCTCGCYNCEYGVTCTCGVTSSKCGYCGDAECAAVA